jgi:hypothetical protein
VGRVGGPAIAIEVAAEEATLVNLARASAQRVEPGSHSRVTGPGQLVALPARHAVNHEDLATSNT